MSFQFALLEEPNRAFLISTDETRFRQAQKCGRGKVAWELPGTLLLFERHNDHAEVLVNSCHPLRHIALRWSKPFPSNTRFLGDVWERSYGDLEWRGISPHRLMPWYFIANRENTTACYGVQTGAASFACWQVDSEGVTLFLDVRSGGMGVLLGERTLPAAILRQRLESGSDSAHSTVRRFCSSLCPNPRLPAKPVIGHNDWYWLFGRNSETTTLEATRRIVEMAPDTPDNRPWSMIDDGWQTPANSPTPHCNGGPWTQGNALFPDMPGTAEKIRQIGAQPGIWIRPLFTGADVPDGWKLNNQKSSFPPEPGIYLDPTVPEVIELVLSDIARLRSWGFKMIKHDFTTFDILGRWGTQMTASHDAITPDGWSFADSSRTTAEVISCLYQSIREAAGSETIIIGCDTVGHLAAGWTDIQRIGDDVSSHDWNRTRRSGINSLAFRSAQHLAFFAVDADCVPVGSHIPERLTQQWLNLVARSGTPLFLSIEPSQLNGAMKKSIKQALETSLCSTHPAEPLDWLDNAVPTCWKVQNETVRFSWSEWEI